MASKNTHGYESCRSQNRDTLEQMVRQHIMYEGTGDAKRFVDAYGREDPRLHSLWNLKLLRHEIRHDIDHGQPAEARRKHLRVARIFESFIGRRYPQTREDWSTSQIELCRALRGRLEAFWSDPAGGNGSDHEDGEQ